ncbi:MAG TPA: peptidoglycan-binding protein [Pyrinomonadaceae bacterium]
MRWVQSSLNRILNLNLPVNGIMDDQTRSAVREFQTKKGLPADGIVGPPTERAIVEASSAPPPTQGAPAPEPPAGGNGQEPAPAATGQEELFEFFPEVEFADNEMSLESDFENWHNELHEGESNGCGCHAKAEVLPELETSFELDGEVPLTLGVEGDPKIIDLTAKGDKSQRLKIRPPEKVWALVLHQMACCFNVKDPLTRFLKMAPHFAILPDGRILQIHPLQAYTPASNGFNAGSVAVEFAGNFPSTRGKWWISKSLKTDAARKANQNQVTPQQIESGRYLVQYLKRVMGLKTILAHRQSSGTRENDPGPDIWYNVGQWAIDNLGLSDGGPDFKVGTGNPIPDLWRKWGQAKPQPELEIGDYESEQWETTPSTGTTTFKYVKDLSGPATECTEALKRAGKTKEEALKLINNQIAVAITMLRKSAKRLKRGSRSSTTNAIFQKIFRVKPGYVPTWLKPTATIKDRGDVVATRCSRVADLLASGKVKFFCTINSANCPDCSNDAAPFACSSWGDESVAPKNSRVVCLGHGFWDDMKAGNTNSMISTLMHEPFHIYYGKYVTAHASDRGKFGGINCIVQFVFETNSRTVPGRVKERCRDMPVRA